MISDSRSDEKLDSTTEFQSIVLQSISAVKWIAAACWHF